LARERLPSWLFDAGRGLLHFVRPTRIYEALVRRSQYQRPRLTPQHLGDAGHVDELAQLTAQLYAEHLLRMQQLAGQHGFQFIAVLQPQIYSGQDYRVRADVEFVERYDAIRLPKVRVAFDASYRELAKTAQQLNKNGIRIFDCTHLFDGKTDNFFLDSHHVNARGDLVVARAIAASLTRSPPGCAP
jgi:hypothetical protein